MYITQRGTTTETVPYGQLSPRKKVAIVRYYVAHGRRQTKAKYNLSNQTMGHLIYHHKDLIEQIEEENFRKAGL